MDIGYPFYLIGIIFYNDFSLTIILGFLYITTIVWGLRKPIIAVASYYAVSIINPQVIVPLYQGLPLAKISAIAALISIVINRHKLQIKFYPFFILIIAFLICSWVSYDHALIKEYATKRFVEFNKIGLMFFLTVWSISNWTDFRLLFYTLIFAIDFGILKNLVETQTKGKWYAVKGTGGWIADSNDWGLALAMSIPLIYGALMKAKTFKKQLFWMGNLAAALLVLTITSSRGAFLGTAIAMSILVLTDSSKFRIYSSVVLVLILVIHYMPSSYPNQIRSIFQSKDVAIQAWESGRVNNDKYTGAERTYYWKLAYYMAKEHPWTGVGWGNYVYARRFYEKEPGTTVAHSTWFQIAAEAGIIALGIYILLIVISILRLLKTWFYGIHQSWTELEIYAKIFMCGILAFCVSASFVSRENSELLFVYMAISLVLSKLCSDPLTDCTGYNAVRRGK